MARALTRSALGILLFALSVRLAAAENLEHAIKATYVVKFPPFVQWPESVLAQSGYFVVCVQGDDEVGALIGRAASGQSIWGRPVAVAHYNQVSRGTGCHVVYLAGSAQQSVAAAVAALRGAPVLTVTDGQAGRGAAGIIDLVVENNRVVFVIDDQAAAESGLIVSSKLLGIARSVKRRG